MFFVLTMGRGSILTTRLAIAKFMWKSLSSMKKIIHEKIGDASKQNLSNRNNGGKNTHTSANNMPIIESHIAY